MFSKEEYLKGKHVLRFRKDGTFRILFLTDLHGGVGMSRQTVPGIQAILHEVKPDMVLIGGDTFGCHIGVSTPEEAEEYLDLMVGEMDAMQIPWAHVYGNHDDNMGVSRQIQQQIYESHPYCVSKYGERELDGVGNYVLPVLRWGSDEVAANIWALDSHDTTPAVNQVNWYYQTSKELERCFGKKIPSILYLHVPLPEYMYMMEHMDECKASGTPDGTYDFGWENSGLFAACLERGDVGGIFCGHEHLLDTSGIYKGIRLSFAASCGYDAGSSNELRGGRLITLYEDKPGQIDTHMIRLRDVMGLRSMSYASRRIWDPDKAPEKDYSIYVNAFHGNGTYRSGEENALSRGNTSPAAVLPFGRLSVGCYNGGYSSGYGSRQVPYGTEDMRQSEERDICRGFSHIHLSGGGCAGAYYNYALTMPCYGDIAASARPDAMKWESAGPGFYHTDLKKCNIWCKFTVSPRAACHKYTFRRDGGMIVVDLSHEGLESYLEEFQGHSRRTVIRAGEEAFEAELEMRGVTVYIYGRCEQAGNVSLWRNYVPLGGVRELQLEETFEKFGVCFSGLKEREAEFRISISTLSMEKARKDVLSETGGFEEIGLEAYHMWDKMLGKIEVEAPTERDKRIFYSNLYHSLVKPSDWSGESCIYGGNGPFVADLMLREMYRAQMPLLFTLYPDISEKIVQTILSCQREIGFVPASFTLSDGFQRAESVENEVLRCCLYDAFIRGVKGAGEAWKTMADAASEGAVPADAAWMGDTWAEAMPAKENSLADLLACYDAGRYDRMWERMNQAVEYLFQEGPDGLPADNQGGALSALYVWYAIGLLPVPGQDKLLIGSPRMCRSVLHLPGGNDFTISREGEGIYVAEACLNGERLSKYFFRAEELRKGGELRLIMTTECV